MTEPTQQDIERGKTACLCEYCSMSPGGYCGSALRFAYALAAQREEDARVAEAEPELEGDPPLSVMHEIQRRGPVPVLRATVAATKRNIAAAIRNPQAQAKEQ
jgi:hypothetical protein